MNLRILTMEGLSDYENQSNLFPIRCKSHYLTEMFLACLPLKTIDGSSKIVIMASAPDKSVRPEDIPYCRLDYFGVSTYHLSTEQINALYRIEPYGRLETHTQSYKRKKQYEPEMLLSPEQEEEYILTIIECALVDIAKRSNADALTIKEIQNTSRIIRESGFYYEKKIDRLCKSSADRRYRAEIYRCLGREIGEAWRLQVTKKGGEDYTTWITAVPDYLDRTDFFKKSKWEEDIFQIEDNLGVQTFSIKIE